jgi:hypothetical protein
MDTYRPYCPMCFNVSPDVASDGTYDCVKERCAWWCEDAQKCAVLVLVETQRKAVKK